MSKRLLMVWKIKKRKSIYINYSIQLRCEMFKDKVPVILPETKNENSHQLEKLTVKLNFQFSF